MTNNSASTLNKQDLYDSCRQHMSDHELPFEGDFVADGEIKRYSAKGDRRNKNEWYVIYESISSKGNLYWTCIYGSWSKIGVKYEFKSYENSSDFDEKERKELHELHRRLKLEAERKLEEGRDEVAIEVQKLWSDYDTTPEANPEEFLAYVTLKGIKPIGVRFGENPNGYPSIVIPLMNIDRELRTLQYISLDKPNNKPFKTFHPGGEKKGNFFIIGEIIDGNPFYIAEGYATGVSVYMATEQPVVIAFDAGNIDPVLENLRKKYPINEITIAGDDDETGREKAYAAAKKYNCKVAIPLFEQNGPEGKKYTDFNDLHQTRGLGEVQKQLENNSESIEETSQEDTNAAFFWIDLPKSDKPKIKERIKKTYEGHWNRDKNAYSIPIKHKTTLEDYLNSHKPSIKFTSKNSFDKYFTLNPNQKKKENLEFVRDIKIAEITKKDLVNFTTLLKDFNKIHGYSFKVRDFEDKQIDDLLNGISDDKQIERIESLYQYYLKIKNSKKEILDIEEKIKTIDESDDKDEKYSIINNPDEWPFIVLGLNYNMEILLSFKGKILKWPVERISEMRIKAVFGLCEEWHKIRDAIVYHAHDKGLINDEIPIKQGVWKVGNRWIVVSGKHACIFDGTSFKELDYPVFEGKLIDFDDEDWIDWNELINRASNCLLENVFEEILIKVQAWNWLDSSMSFYATAFIFLNPFQLYMSWRPWIYLTGSKGTGKSTFFDSIISGIYGALVSRLDKSTPHATAQTIGNTGLIPIFDEFEKHKHIPEVLELAKLFNAGGRKTSGTPGEKANVYNLKHLAWFGSIYLPRQLGQDAAQESRMVKLEVKKLSNETPVLEKIDALEGKKIAAKIISSMIFNWNKIEEGANQLNKKRNEIISDLPGIEIRTVENFMYASSLLNILQLNQKYSVPSWAVRRIEDDSEKIISAILSSMTRIDGESYSIGEVLHKTSSDVGERFSKNLEQNGIKFTSKEGSRYLAFRCETISRHLLKDTDFRDLDIQAPLSRIEEAVSSHPVKILGKLERCVLIPISKIGLDCN